MQEMDDFTKNMLERAKARRQKLNSHLSQAGRTPRPLQEHQASNIDEHQVVNKDALTTPEIDRSTYNVRDRVVRQLAIDENDAPTSAAPCEAKLSSAAKSKLQQLGNLYADDGADISSPIHKSQEKVLAGVQVPSELNKCRLGRLNQLAETINQWDDDLSHPDIKKKTTGSEPAKAKSYGKSAPAPAAPSAKITRTETKLVESTVTTVIHMATINKGDGEDKVNKTTATIQGVNKKNTAQRKDSTEEVRQSREQIPRVTAVTSSSNLADQANPNTKQTQWDQAIKLTLESQGIKTTNEPKQTYRFGDTPQSSAGSSPHRSPRSSTSSPKVSVLRSPNSPRNSGTFRKSAASPVKGSLQKTPLKKTAAPLPPTTTFKKSQAPLPPSGFKKNTVPSSASPVKSTKIQSTIKRNSPSPRKSPKMGVSALDSESSVLKRAAMFEKHLSPVKKGKDPAELTLAERKALFEKNKGEVLLPKVAFATPLPAKLRTPPKPLKVSTSVGKLIKPPVKVTSVGNIKDKFEKDLVETTNVNMSKLEREKDMEFLKNRWQRNRTEVSGYADETTGPAPPPPPMPDYPALSSPVTRNYHASSPKRSPLPCSPQKAKNVTPEPYKDSPETLKAIQGVKSIVMSPPKKGKLYPNLSDIEASEGSEPSSPSSSMNDSKNSNIYLNMSFGDILEASKSIPMTPPRTQESAVLSEMDQLLDDALGEVTSDEEAGGPTPPKQYRGACNSDSFEYERGTPKKEPSTPLLRTVSLYRKQQSSSNTPVSMNKCVHVEPSTPVVAAEMGEEDEAAAVKAKMTALKAEMDKQTTIISQASNALTVCLSTFEFSGSEEQVEGEKLLLLAENKRKACDHEYQRLKVEGTLRPRGANSAQLNEHGSLTISNMTLLLRREALRNMAAEESMLQFVCLVRSEEKVVCSQVVRGMGPQMQGTTLNIPGELRLDGLYGDFKAAVEVYYMNLDRGLMLPHHVKYHLPGGKKDRKLLTPSKSKKSQARLMTASPAGPYAVRSSSFKLCGYVMFSLREVKRTHWTLNKVTPQVKANESPLEGSMGMHITCSLKLDAEHRGFLNMFNDVSGLGAWHRRWCLLSANHLSFWKYPEDENTQIPLGSIDLRSVITPTVGQVSREICARNNTFLLETTRPREAHDKESLVVLVERDVTRIRHLLCSDTKEEALEWCGHLNKSLVLIRAWNCQV